MDNVIECICRNLLTSKELRVVSYPLGKEQEFVVIGIDNTDSCLPIVLTKKPYTESFVSIPSNLIDRIIIIP